MKEAIATSSAIAAKWQLPFTPIYKIGPALAGPGSGEIRLFPSDVDWGMTQRMCWSAEVSAAFAAAEWTTIFLLVRRNERFDRAFALALTPIAAQEVLQWVLWNHISPDGLQCDSENITGSLLVRQITSLVPLGWVWFARRDVAQRRIARWLLGATALFVTLRVAMIAHSHFTFPIRCTTVGPNHHQAWVGYLGRYESLQPAYDIISFSLYWMLPVFSLLYLFRPKWLGWTICSAVVVTMVPCLFWYTPEELGSVWCWMCSSLSAIAFIYPYVQRKIDRRNALENPNR